MGGGDKPHINGKRLVAADPLHLPLLNCPQQADLHHWRDIAYLIKKQRAAIRFDKASFPPPIRPGKRPFSWPKSSDSSSDSFSAAQLSVTNGLSRRSLQAWMACATSSLPVPDSP